MSWPGYDPFYNHNTGDNNSRRSFYAVSAVPDIFVDGVYETNFPPFAQYYDTRIATPTPVSVDIDGSYDAGTGAIDVTATATTTAALPGGNVQYRIFVALIEDNIFFNGSNTTDWHRHVMRDMAPTAGGTVVTFTGDLPQSAQTTVSFTMDPIYVEAECSIVVWMQEAITKEVYNADWVLVTELGDLTSAPEALPLAMELGRNFPNPFNPSTAIPVSVERAGNARLEIVGVDGRVVRTLHDGDLAAGNREFRWDGTDAAGQGVASGVYLARLLSADGIQSRRLVLLK